ncbi:MAG: Gp15 family bacteriophage protein, partial [Oscillospiraceae bacterium]
KANKAQQFYDLKYDEILIQQSLAKQYGILPKAQEELSWADFSNLVSGLMYDTPLAQVVSIRSERDMDIVSRFTKEQKAIRAQWQMFLVRNSKARDNKENIGKLQETLKAMFGGA